MGGARGARSDSAGGMSLEGVDRPQRLRENDEETQREESSSTESTHQEVKEHICEGVHLKRFRFGNLFKSCTCFRSV